MSNEELRAQASRSSGLIKIGDGLWATGMMIVMLAAITWITMAVMAGDYFSNPKAVRDAADAASGILSQQGSIEAIRSGSYRWRSWAWGLSYLASGSRLRISWPM